LYSYAGTKGEVSSMEHWQVVLLGIAIATSAMAIIGQITRLLIDIVEDRLMASIADTILTVAWSYIFITLLALRP